MKLNSNKHKVMCVGKSDLRCERTSMCSKFAAPFEEGDRDWLIMDEERSSQKMSQGNYYLTEKTGSHFVQLHQQPQLELCLRLLQIPDLAPCFQVWENSKDW